MQRWPILKSSAIECPALQYFNGLLILSFWITWVWQYRDVCIWVPQQQPLDNIERVLVQNTSSTLSQCVRDVFIPTCWKDDCRTLFRNDDIRAAGRIWWYTPVTMATYTLKMRERTLHRAFFFQTSCGLQGLPYQPIRFIRFDPCNLQAKFM